MATKTNQKKRKKNLLYTDYDCLTKEEIVTNIDTIELKLKKHFKYHIGKENASNPYDVFVSVYNQSPEDMHVFKRDYWWGMIKRVLMRMRSRGELFVINRGNKLYVLQTKEEAKDFRDTVDRHIATLELHKKKANEWVKKKKWRDL